MLCAASQVPRIHPLSLRFYLSRWAAAFLAFCCETAYRGEAKGKRGARLVGDGGNEQHGSQLHGAEQARQRHESESRSQDNDILRARLERLTGALAAQHRQDRQAPSGSEEKGASSGALGNVLSLALRVTSEFVAAVLVGTAIGWGIDRAAGTSPIFLIVLLLMGAAAGFWNVYRIGIEKPGAERK